MKLDFVICGVQKGGTTALDSFLRQHLDYRDIGRLTYAPLREASDAAWRCVADGLTGL